MMQPSPIEDITLITISGEDKPGVSATLLGILADHNATILDIGQAVIHSTLNLGMLVQAPSQESWREVAKEILYRTYELNLKVKFESIEKESYAEWVKDQGKERHIITILGNTLTANAMARLCGILFDNNMNIQMISRLSGRIPLDQSKENEIAAVELSVRGTPKDSTAMSGEFLDMAQELGVDISFQKDNVHRRNRRLVVFDMDSTLIQTEVIDELAAAADVKNAVSAITEAAMNGEIDFQESLRERLSLLKNLDESVMKDVAEKLPITNGAEKLINMLKHLGYKVAVISGGFTYFGESLKKRLDIDYVYANELEVVDGKLTGNVLGDIIDGPRKASILKEIADQEHISLAQVIAVGDGANDLPMLSVAGLGIAFQAKKTVRESADHNLTSVGLDGILYLIGVRDREILDQFR
jgi:phosphoserine phosphatase